MFKRILGLTGLIIIFLVACLGADVARFFTTPLANSQPQLVEVTPGTTFRALMHQLSDARVIRKSRDERYLSWYAQLTGKATQVKSGEYLIPARQRPAQLVSLLVSGKIRQHRLTIVEGWRFAQIMQKVEGDDALKHTLSGKSDAQIMAALGHPGEKPEGRFMPDTYMFPRGLSDVAFLKRAYNAMSDFLDQAWQARGQNTAVESPYQALILASIVEKETAVSAERGRVAGVYTRRLEKGMRLQSDPTVIYGIPNYDGNIHKSDLERDTPYNTYTRAGLPPTPIASPSRASIRAALHPKPGTALYFVSRGDGTHVFSDTLSEQNQAVRRYQLGGS
ncbi:endolytic transglycosylase MltG [Salinisphaera sp. Q1T1-3]|uniref:endolytic transglycosylase MltG n=1 Tax=Salinisphaera sp. Q1T1-3 TaxID=2321229 RepID=UPI000E771132|nr:endolytic transglycosylase MltG [Salinisphaera sp. Q1T1-3]RJS95095.1 endolytic transglycosylase MltG [Salinisphaera sp. Q1T1-3]